MGGSPLGGADIPVCHLMNFPKGNTVNSRGRQPTDSDHKRTKRPYRGRTIVHSQFVLSGIRRGGSLKPDSNVITGGADIPVCSVVINTMVPAVVFAVSP